MSLVTILPVASATSSSTNIYFLLSRRSLGKVLLATSIRDIGIRIASLLSILIASDVSVIISAYVISKSISLLTHI